MGVSKNSGTPKSSILIGFSIISPSILGYHYFRKPPNGDLTVIYYGGKLEKRPNDLSI